MYVFTDTFTPAPLLRRIAFIFTGLQSIDEDFATQISAGCDFWMQQELDENHISQVVFCPKHDEMYNYLSSKWHQYVGKLLSFKGSEFDSSASYFQRGLNEKTFSNLCRDTLVWDLINTDQWIVERVKLLKRLNGRIYYLDAREASLGLKLRRIKRIKQQDKRVHKPFLLAIEKDIAEERWNQKTDYFTAAEINKDKGVLERCFLI